MNTTHRAAIVLPDFQMGLKEQDYEKAQSEGWIRLPSGTYRYPGKTVALTGARAAKNLMAYTQHVHGLSLQEIDIVTDAQTERLLKENRHRYYFLLGTRSHKGIREILNEHNHDFDFEFSPDAWSIIDKREGNTYHVADPSQVKSADQAEGADYALLERLVDTTNERVLYAVGGMWDSGTEGASEFLLGFRREISRAFGDDGFQYLLKFKAGTSWLANIEFGRDPIMNA